MTLGDAVASAMAVTKDEDLKTGCEQIGRSARISFGVARKLMAAVNVEGSMILLYTLFAQDFAGHETSPFVIRRSYDGPADRAEPENFCPNPYSVYAERCGSAQKCWGGRATPCGPGFAVPNLGFGIVDPPAWHSGRLAGGTKC
jgi:hypothetical protein